jgi:hypothetical protein
MRLFVVSLAALFVLVGAQLPASAAAAPALVKKPAFGQTHALVEKAHGWKGRWYRPRVYGYRYRPHYYKRSKWRRGWYRPRVYGYRYRPYHHKRGKWRRRWW